MELAVVIAVAVIFIFPIYIYFFYGIDTKIPTVSILEHLPNGVLNPIVQNPQNYQRTMHKIAKRFGPVFQSWFGLRFVLITAVPEDVAHLLSSENFRRSDNVLALFRTICPGGVFAMPRVRHRAVRRTLRSSFSTEMLESFQPQMNAAVKELCEVLEGGQGKVEDISAVLAMTTFRVITNVAFGSGMEKNERREFNRVANQFFEEMMQEVMGYPIRQYLGWLGVRRRFWECKEKIDRMCRVFIRRRLAESKEEREKRNPDILDVFLNLDSADEEVVASLVLEFALAGSHTTNQVLAWSIYETCCNERVVKEIDAEMSRVLSDKPLAEPITYEELQQLPYIHKVWRETLRLHPISAGTARTAMAEVVLKGSDVRVTKGRTVVALYSVLQLDPELWKDPLAFRPERWGYGNERGEGEMVTAGAYIPFGLGFRSCAGKFLADYEGPHILAELHRHFRFELACEPEEVVGCTAFVETPRYASKKGGEFDMGVPVRARAKR